MNRPLGRGVARDGGGRWISGRIEWTLKGERSPGRSGSSAAGNGGRSTPDSTMEQRLEAGWNGKGAATAVTRNGYRRGVLRGAGPASRERVGSSGRKAR